MSTRGSGLNLVRTLRQMPLAERPFQAEDQPSASRAGEQPARVRSARPRRKPVEPEDINDPAYGQYVERMNKYLKRVGSAKEIENIKTSEDRRGSDYGVQLPEYKKGGLVKKTQVVKVHKGELVIPANRVKAVEKAVKKAGLKPLKK